MTVLTVPIKPTPDAKPSPFQGAGAAYLPLGGALVGAGGGWLVDVWADSAPVALIVGIFLGIAAGLYHMIREGAKK